MWMLIVVLLAVPAAAACPDGYEDMKNGTCASMQASSDPVKDAPYQASDEKPPEDKMPSYQREGIHADMPASTAAQDALRDEERMNADTEGKKAAGLK